MLNPFLKLVNPLQSLKNSQNIIIKRYAGHSKWANIRHTKGALDKKRGAEFAKIGLELIAAIRAGGTDPQFNLRLSAALALAKSKDFPKKNLEMAFKKATGKTDEPMNEVCFHGMGPHSLAIVIEAYTNNRNRTIKAVRSLLTRAGGSITDVAWMFEKKGKILITSKEKENKIDFDQLMEDVITVEAEDVIQAEEDNHFEIICSFEQLGNVSSSLDKLNKYQLKSIEPYHCPTVEWNPPENVDESTVQNDIQTFLEQVEDLDEVTRFHTNLPRE